MQVESNRDISQNELYAGIGIAGALGGAALAVRATSPIYKDDKKAKDKTTSASASSATNTAVAATDSAPVAPNPNSRQWRNTKEGKQYMKQYNQLEHNIDAAYDKALQVNNAIEAGKPKGNTRTERTAHANRMKKIKAKF